MGPRLRPAASPKLCREPDGRRPPAAGGGGRAGGARAGGAAGTAGPAAPPGLRPECLPLAETSRGGACPMQKPAKKEEPFGSPVNVIRF